jgi:hypothetical protein
MARFGTGQCQWAGIVASRCFQQPLGRPSVLNRQRWRPLFSGYPLPHGIGRIPHRRVESGCRISRSEPESDFTWQLLGWANFDSAPISETKLPCLSCVPPVGASRPRVPEFGRSFEIPIASIGQDRPSLQCGNSRDPWASGSGNRVLAAVPEDLKTARPNRYIPVVRALAAPERRPASPARHGRLLAHMGPQA